MINTRVKRFCCEDISKIENYNEAINDQSQTWHCHHRLETDKGMTVQQLKDKNLYFNRPASELIFLTCSEHLSLHGKNMLQETRNKMSISRRDKKLSDEHKHKISESHKGIRPTDSMTEEEINEMRRKQRESIKQYWQNEEVKRIRIEGMKGEKNGMYGKRHSEETKRKLSEARKAYYKRLKEANNNS